MTGVLLFENVLDSAAYVSADSTNAEQTGFSYQNLKDGRLDTQTKFTEVAFDLRSSDEASGSSGSYTTTTITLSDLDSKSFAYWVGYEVELTSGTHSGESAVISEYDQSTNVATLETAFTGAGSGTYSLRIVPTVDTIGIAGHNLSDYASTSSDFIVSFGDALGSYTQVKDLGKIKSNDVICAEFTAQKKRYVKFTIPANSTSVVACIYLGQSIVLGEDFDKFALRAPFSPPAIVQTRESRFKLSNSNEPFPSSYKKVPFDVNLDFQHLDAENLRSHLHRGMYELISTQPFFISWDTTNFSYSSDYPEAAFCWVDRQLQPPRFNDYDGRFQWSIRAKGLKE